MSTHFKRSLIGIGVLVACLVGAFLWLKHKIEQPIRLPSFSSSTKLGTDEHELIAFNEKTHRLSVITSSGTVKMYARNPTIRIKNDGRVVVDKHLFGFEMRPFLGVGYSDTTRALLGVEPFYWGAFDASAAIGISLDKQYTIAKPYIAVGYNCWGNLAVNAGVNPIGLRQFDVIIFMSVKL